MHAFLFLFPRSKDIPDLDKKIEETNAAIEVLRKDKEGKDETLKGLESQMDVARNIQQVICVRMEKVRMNCGCTGMAKVRYIFMDYQTDFDERQDTNACTHTHTLTHR